jgi:DNA-binding transcriptional ArsR family regulator
VLPRLVEALRRCHELLIAPHWGRMRAVLEADIGRRALTLVDGGVQALFTELLPGSRLGRRTARGARPTHPARDLHGRRRPARSGPSAQCLQLAERRRRQVPGHGCIDPLSGGGCRAALGGAPANAGGPLPGPGTHEDSPAHSSGRTSDDSRLGITPSAVPQHLVALRGAGLVSTQRTGRTALHLRTERATNLLDTSAP